VTNNNVNMSSVKLTQLYCIKTFCILQKSMKTLEKIFINLTGTSHCVA